MAPPKIRGDDDRQRAAVLMVTLAFAADVPLASVLSETRGTLEASRIRHIAMYLAHVVWSWPERRVADAFGRARASVQQCLPEVENLRDDPRFDAALDRLETLVRDLDENLSSLLSVFRDGGSLPLLLPQRPRRASQ